MRLLTLHFISRQIGNILATLVVLALMLRCCVPTSAVTTGFAPSPRFGMGFTATPDGMLYAFGGYDSGEELRTGAQREIMLSKEGRV